MQKRANRKQPEEVIESMRKMRSEGYPCWYIGEKHGLTGVTAWRYTKNVAVLKVRWTPEEETMLLKLRLQDKMLMKDIAVKLNKTKSACYHKYYILMNALKTS